MARGSAPGERRGGRVAGQANKRTVEQQLEVAAAVSESKKVGKKLGKVILDDFANLFAGMAAVYQPNHPSVPKGQGNPHADEGKFDKYAVLAVKTAALSAEFQSPKLRALALAPIPGDYENQVPARPASGKSVGALAAYQLLRDADIIDIVPVGLTEPEAEEAKQLVAQVPKKANGKGNGHG